MTEVTEILISSIGVTAKTTSEKVEVSKSLDKVENHKSYG